MHKIRLKKLFAVWTAFLLILVQLMAPALSLAISENEVPTVTVGYLTQQGPASVMASVSIINGIPVYWATVPADADLAVSNITVSSGMPGEISPVAEPVQGFAAPAQSLMDAPSFTLSFYQGEQLLGTAPLFISYLPIPTMESQNAIVPVEYYDRTNNQLLFSGSVELAPGQHQIPADPSQLPSEYRNGEIEPAFITVTVNEQGVAAPESAAFYVNPSVTEPTMPPVPQNVNVIVEYRNAGNDEILYSHPQECGIGSNRVAPNVEIIPANFVLVNPDAQEVYVDEQGIANPSVVVFYLTENVQPTIPPSPINVTVEYRNAGNDEILYSHPQECGIGSNRVAPNVEIIPANFVLVNPDAQEVYVDEQGIANPSVVIFYLTENVQTTVPPAPAKVTVPIEYRLADTDEILATDVQECTVGSNTIAPKTEFIPSELLLLNSDPQTVMVMENGECDPSTVVFYLKYAAAAPTTAPATVLAGIVYVDQNTGETLFSVSYDFPVGKHQINADPSLLPDGYAFVNTEPITLTIDPMGYVDPNPVIFYAVAQSQPTEAPSAQPTDVPPAEEYTVLQEIGQYGETANKSVNFRKKPSTDASAAAKGIKKGTKVWVISLVQPQNSSEQWYLINYNGTDCFVRSDLLTLKASEAAVEVSFVDEANGKVILSNTVSLAEGSYPFVPDASLVPGYDLVSTDPVTVTVAADGTATPNDVVFYVREKSSEPVSVEITVNYLNNENRELIFSEKKTLGEGNNVIAPDASLIPGWKLLSQEEQTVTVSSDGKANPESVLFFAEKEVIPPAEATVSISYINEEKNETIYTASVKLTEGSTPIAPDASLIPGYQLRNTEPVTVQVSADGKAFPEQISFYAVPIPAKPVEVNIPVYYINIKTGEQIASSTVTLSEGQTSISPDASLIPGYDLVSTDPNTVTVSADGTAKPAIVYFTAQEHQEIPVSVTIPVHYLNSATGEEVAQDNISLEEGERQVSPKADILSGYILDSTQPVTVTVNHDGTAIPDSVTFSVSETPPVDGQLKILSVDAYGQQLAEPVTKAIPYGSYQADEFYPGDVAGYDFASVRPNEITVDKQGNITPYDTLTFTYVVKPAVTAAVNFNYVCNGKKITGTQKLTLEEGEHDVQEYVMIFDGYTLEKVSSPKVVISSDGSVSPSEITFSYTKNKTEAEFHVYYLNSIGEAIAEKVTALKPGIHTVSPDMSAVPSGFTLSESAQPVSVTVSKDLIAEPSSISFSCYPSSVVGILTIQYMDSTKGTVIATETRSFSPGYHLVEPNDAIVAQYGKYVRSDVITTNTIVVSETGQTSPSVMTFYYQPEEIDIYQGYMLVTSPALLRSSASTNGKPIQTLNQGTLLWTNGQYSSGSTVWQSVQTVIGGSVSGWIEDVYVVRITPEEAAALMEEEEKVPDQKPGYYITIVNNAPLRNSPNAYASAKFLNPNTVIYVYGQEYGEDGYIWHYANENGNVGYIRDGQIRQMTDSEVWAYQKGLLTPTPTPAPAPTYSPYSSSSYGYVTASSVNFRATPDVSGRKLSTIKRYGMALIIGSTQVNGVTWYNINYKGTIGWVSGEFFHQMSLTEFNSFVGSAQYNQGLSANSTDSSTGSGSSSSSGSSSASSGSSTQGQVATVEEWNVSTWQNTGVSAQSTYVPFNPYATPVPTPTPDPFATADPSTTPDPDATGNPGATVTPEATFVIGTMIPIDYLPSDTEETGSNLTTILLIGGAIILLGVAGGVYAYTNTKNKRRKQAASEAAKRSAENQEVSDTDSTESLRRATIQATTNRWSSSSTEETHSAQENQPNWAGYDQVSQQNIDVSQSPYSRPYSTFSGENLYSTGSSATTLLNEQGSYDNDSSMPSYLTQNPYRSAEVQSLEASQNAEITQNPYQAYQKPSEANPYTRNASESSFFSDTPQQSEEPIQTSDNPFARPTGRTRRRMVGRSNSDDQQN